MATVLLKSILSLSFPELGRGSKEVFVMNSRQTNLHLTKKFGERRRRGQTLVEFAMVVPILILLTAGLIQFAIIFGATNAVSQVTREGSRLAAVFATKKEKSIPLTKESNQYKKDYLGDDAADKYIRDRMDDVARAANLNPADIGVLIEPAPATRKIGDAVTVTVVYNLKKKVFMPVIAEAVPSNYTKRSVSMIEGG